MARKPTTSPYNSDAIQSRQPLEGIHPLKDVLGPGLPLPWSPACFWNYVARGYIAAPGHIGKLCFYTDSYLRQVQKRILEGTFLPPSKNKLPHNHYELKKLAAQSPPAQPAPNHNADVAKRLAARNQRRRAREQRKRELARDDMRPPDNEEGRQHPGMGIGILMGPSSGLFLLDIDCGPSKPHAKEATEWFADHSERLPETLETDTASGGKHFYFLDHPAVTRPLIGKIHPGVDIVGGDKGYAYWHPVHGCRCNGKRLWLHQSG
jgi:hypothetical protein